MECCDTATAEPELEDAPTPPEPDAESDSWTWIRIGFATLLAGNAMVVGLAVNLSSLEANLRLFLEIALLGSTLLVLELVGRRLLQNAWEAARNLEISFEFLFVAGILGALATSVVSMILGEGPIATTTPCRLEETGRYSKQR